MITRCAAQACGIDRRIRSGCLLGILGALLPLAALAAESESDAYATTSLKKLSDEGAIDFQAVDRERGQAAERRLSHAEIVDGDAHALPSQGTQSLPQMFGILEQRALRDFDVDARCTGRLPATSRK